MTEYCKIEYCPNPQALEVNTSFVTTQHPAIAFIIEQIHGVEEVVFYGLYNFRFTVLVEKMFDRQDIAQQIEEKINLYFEGEGVKG